MRISCIFLLLLSGFTGVFGQKNIVTSATEINHLGTIPELSVYNNGNPLMQFSSYDTTGGNNDGFGGEYSFIRKTEEGDLVIFEDNLDGVINRIWTPTPTTDTLDFYFNNAKEPSFSISFIDLFTGKVFPFVEPLCGNEIGGYYCYLPIPYKNGCKIILRGKKLQFYQIQYRHLPKRVKVTSFSPDGELFRKPLADLENKWEKVDSMGAYESVHTDSVLVPGQTISLAQIQNGGRIMGIRLYGPELYTGQNKQVDLRITWDEEQLPAINLPVADFFGYAFGKVSMQSLLLGSKGNVNYCYFPMPFDQQAKVELIYREADSLNSPPLRIKSDIYFSHEQRNPDEEGKFYAFWNKEKQTSDGHPHIFLEGKGKGHYVGTILQAQGLNPGMTSFFEGDDRTTIDGKMTVHGTGSEDYFNGGWYALMDRWDRNLSLPLHGSLAYSLPYSRTGGYRLFISDKMSFTSSIRHTIEHGPTNNNVPADYTSVALYYADGPVGVNQQKPENALTGIFIPRTFVFYPQLISYSFRGGVEVDGNVLSSTTDGMVRIDLSELPKGHYRLFADMEKTPDGAEIQIWQRQKPAGDPVSFYATHKTRIDHSFLCEITISDFIKTMTIRFNGREGHSKLNISRWILERTE